MNISTCVTLTSAPRNGPLRRKFDGIKYVARKCEDLLYELSLSGKYRR
jgi:hypothetical protein